MKKFEEDFEKYLNLYLDGRLDETEASEFEKYLAENPEKAAEYEAYKALDLTAKGEPLPDLPQGYWEGLESRINKRVAGMPESRGFWARIAERYFSFNRTIKVAATALTLIAVFLISRQYIIGTKVTEMGGPSAVRPERSAHIRGGRTAETAYELKKEPEQGFVSDSTLSGIHEENIGVEKREAEDREHEKAEIEAGDIADKVQMPSPVETEESTPAPSIMPQSAAPEAETFKEMESLEAAQPRVELQTMTEGVASESLKQVADSGKVQKGKYTAAAAGQQQSEPGKARLPKEGYIDSLSPKQQAEKSVIFDTLNPEADSEFIKKGEGLYTLPYSAQPKGLPMADNMQRFAPLKLDDFPYIPESEYSFTEPALEERITGEFDMSLKDYNADSLQERQNALRLEGDSLIQAYNVALDPVKKLNLFQQIVNKYLVVVQESKSDQDAEKCENLLELGFQNNIILYPEYNAYRDSVKMLIREEK